MDKQTGFVWHEVYGWHEPGNAAAFVQPGGYIQPDRHAENSDTKRRLAELVAVSGLGGKLKRIAATPATVEDICLFHTKEYVAKIQEMSAGSGGDAGEITNFAHGGYDIAALSAGGVIELARSVWKGEVKNGYALCRPPGHHADADRGRGFCIFGNAVIAIKRLQKEFGVKRVATFDWDVHHGNGTQTAFYADPSVLTISIHQDRYFPPDMGMVSQNGEGPGAGANINIPLPPGSGHGAYLEAIEKVVIPAFDRFKPEIIFVPSGFDASAMDPLGRMLCNSETYRLMTRKLMIAAERLCGGKLVMSHEGGYSTAYVPFCGIAVLEELSGIKTDVEDPFMGFFGSMPGQELQPHQLSVINESAALVSKIPVG